MLREHGVVNHYQCLLLHSDSIKKVAVAFQKGVGGGGRQSHLLQSPVAVGKDRCTCAHPDGLLLICFTLSIPLWSLKLQVITVLTLCNCQICLIFFFNVCKLTNCT